MSFLYRRIYFIIALIIFLSLLPVLIIYSLGYNIDFSNRSIESSLNIRLESIPISSDIIVNDEQVSNITPTDIRILGDKNISLKIEKDGYASENFILTGESEKNTSVKITSLYLLNQDFNTLNTLDTDALDYVYFAGDNIIYKESQQEKIRIKQINSIGGFNNDEVNQINAISIDETPIFEDIQNDTFFDYENKLLLWKRSGSWSILDFKSEWENNENQSRLFEFNINSIESVDQRNIIFSSQNHYLYQLNLESLFLSIIDTQTIAITQTEAPDQLWTFNIDGINKVDRINFNDQNDIVNLTFENELALDDIEFKEIASSCFESNECNFEIVNSLAGNMILVQDSLFYYQSNQGNKKLIKINPNVASLNSQRDTIFFASNGGGIYSYNTILNNTIYLGNVQGDILNLMYIDEWKRLMIFTDQDTRSIWFDKDIDNKNIVKYSVSQWNNQTCGIYIFDLTLVCKKDGNEIIYYQNNDLF